MLLPNVLAAQKAREAGAIDAILVRDGFALEATKANVFIATKGVLRTAPNGPRILPGVTAPNPDEAGQQAVGFNSGSNNSAQYNVNGLRGEENNVSIDGARVIDIGSNNGTIITANVDMVQEVKVQTSNYAAEHGASGVQIIATTKGGGRGTGTPAPRAPSGSLRRNPA
jgi:hypothetical protein